MAAPFGQVKKTLATSFGSLITPATGGGVVPPVPMMVARNAVVMTGPGHGSVGLLTGDGTEKTYTIDFKNVSGAPMTTASLVTLGYNVQADGVGTQKLNVGNDVTITSATVEYPIGGGSPANLDVGTTSNGSIRSGAGVALTAAVPNGATARLVLKATPPNTQKYSINFGLAGIRTHALDNTLNPCGFGIGDSISTNDGSYCIDAATDNYPWTQMSVIGNKLQRAASMATDYAALAFALNANLFILFGTNDFSARTQPQMQADLLTLSTACVSAGSSVPFAWTLPPLVFTAGAGTFTPGDQTQSASEAVRVAHNTAVRTTLSGAIRVLEMADALETFRNSGYWKYGSADSFHLSDDEAVTVTTVSSQTALLCAAMTTPSAIGAAASLVSTSGANAGVSRGIASIAGTQVSLSSAFPNTVAIGDTFTLKPVTNKSTTDGTHFMTPYSGGIQYSGFFIARDLLRGVMLGLLAAVSKAPYTGSR